MSELLCKHWPDCPCIVQGRMSDCQGAEAEGMWKTNIKVAAAAAFLAGDESKPRD